MKNEALDYALAGAGVIKGIYEEAKIEAHSNRALAVLVGACILGIAGVEVIKRQGAP